jgi:hypothetical protein
LGASGHVLRKWPDRAIRSNLFCRPAAKKDFRFYPLRTLRVTLRAMASEQIPGIKAAGK